MYHLGFYGFPCQHALAKYGTQNPNMSCIGGRDCNIVPSYRSRGDYFNYHIVNIIDDERLPFV